MSNTENNRFIYSKTLGEKIPVSEQEFKDFYKEATRIRKLEQYHHRCFCPKQFIWKCDGDCDICEYHSAGTLSLDAENTEDDLLPAIDSQLGKAHKLQGRLSY